MPGTAVCETDDAASTAMTNSAEHISPAPEHAPTPAPAPRDLFVETLAQREEYRDAYWQRDGIADDRLLWRAQSFRHLTHPLPGQTILELGCGNNRFTRPLHKVTRGHNPITAVTFAPGASRPNDLPAGVDFVSADALPGKLEGQQFDFIVAMDLLDKRNCAEMLQNVYELLKPGGQAIFYESNPWNLFLKVRRTIGRLFGERDPRRLLNRPELYELMSEIGFIRVFAVFNDFVYRLTRPIAWLFRNLSILLENCPGVRTCAGSILVHAQKPPRVVERTDSSLFEHESMRNSVSVVIPCHNEEMNIGPLVTRLRALFGEYLHEIIPVDDNSKDSTRQVIQKLADEDPRIKPVFRTPPNGVGRAITDGYRAATGKWVLSMDCDFQHLLPEVRDLFDAANEGFDVVVGSRFNRHSVLLNYPFQKIVANRGFHVLAQIVLLRRFRDLTNNLKLIRREVLDKLQLTQPGFSINAETGLQPLYIGCKVKEVPISWINRTPDMGTSSFKLVKVGGGYWQVLLSLWQRSVFGAGPYKKLEKIGVNRKTWRGE
jgi:dolichol-phosphate mannosyltransferase